MSVIRFEESSHYYTRDGKPQHDADLRVARKQNLYPSVTTIDKAQFTNDFLQRWKMNELAVAACENPKQPHEDNEHYANRIYDLSLEKARTAATFGKEIHDAIEHYPQLPMNQELMPWFLQFEAWWRDNNMVPLEREVILLDHDLGVAGRCDLIGMRNSVLTVPDWKGLAIETPLPTPTGWTTMGEVRVGEFVIGEDGKPCKVTGKGPIFNKICYKISFDDTSSIICDCDHLWKISHGYSGQESSEVLSAATLSRRYSEKPRGYHFKIPNASPLELPEKEFRLDPYLLGVWLGDGSESEGKITLGEKKKLIVSYISSLGLEIREFREDNYYIKGLRAQLRQIGVFGNKHVPYEYLRGSIDQRLAILRGLMDTDGNWNKVRKQANFVSTNPALADAVYELVVSLGCRASKSVHEAHGFGTSCIAHSVFFTPNGFNPFLLNTFNQPEAEMHLSGSAFCRRRLIVGVEAIDPVPTQCISVGSKDSMYLAGRQMVPTHNTQNVKVDEKGRKKPMFYDSWARQLAFYAVCYAKRTGSFPVIPECVSVIIDSNEGGLIYPKVWDKDEILSAYEDFVLAVYAWQKKKKYWPAQNGKWNVTINLALPV